MMVDNQWVRLIIAAMWVKVPSTVVELKSI